jgi:glycosyltransferase involved in cell wall biosynthesis
MGINNLVNLHKPKDNSRNPLVSIIVMTYNSLNYVLETLESAKAQTYQNIELIVTDDASVDETVRICKEWIANNKDRFVNTKLITIDVNSGIPANLNRGVREANGEWIKFIAGDDILLPDCILDNLNFIKANESNVEVIHSNSKYYENCFTEENYLFTRNVTLEPLAQNHKSSKYQFKIILWAPSVNAPSIFIKKELIERLNYYSEVIRFMEDWPMWLKIISNGVPIFSLNKETVGYRLNNFSASNKGRDVKIYSDIYKKMEIFSQDQTYPHLSLIDLFVKKYEYFVKLSIDALHLNRRNFFCKSIFFGLLLPSTIYEKARVRFFILRYK